MTAKKPYLLICEGDSEFAYIQELNRFLNERGMPIVFLAHNAGGGGFRNLRQVCRAIKTRKNGRTFIMADEDVYRRDDDGNGAAYERERDCLPPFLFQRWNFEDFLLMHYPPAIVSSWREVAERIGHLVNPKRSDEYLPVFKAFCDRNQETLRFLFPYEKGDVPFGMTQAHVDNLLANNATKSFPHSGFAELLGKLMH